VTCSSPCIELWISQWYLNVPAFSALIVFDPLENGVVSKLPSSAVMLWLVPSSFVTVMVSPTFAVKGVGEKLKFLIVIVEPPDAADDDDPDPVDDEDEEDDEVDDAVDESLEQPTSASTATTGTTTAAVRRRILEIYDARTSRPGRSPVGSPSM